MGSQQLTSKSTTPTSRFINLQLWYLLSYFFLLPCLLEQMLATNGKHLSRCYKTHTNLCMTLKDACGEACESSNSCVGYDIGSSNLGEQCSLFPSSLSFTTCPTGYTLEETKWNGINHVPSSMAETSEDLVGNYISYATGYACYAKTD